MKKIKDADLRPALDKNDTYTDRWVSYQNIDFTDQAVSYYILDTRDFCIYIVNNRPDKIEKITTLPAQQNPAEYLFTPTELVQLLNRYYQESGGNIEWRYFSLMGKAHLLTADWQMKYINIVNIPKRGLFIYDFKKDYIYPKTILNEPINKEALT